MKQVDAGVYVVMGSEVMLPSEFRTIAPLAWPVNSKRANGRAAASRGSLHGTAQSAGDC